MNFKSTVIAAALALAATASQAGVIVADNFNTLPDQSAADSSSNGVAVWAPLAVEISSGIYRDIGASLTSATGRLTSEVSPSIGLTKFSGDALLTSTGVYFLKYTGAAIDQTQGTLTFTVSRDNVGSPGTPTIGVFDNAGQVSALQDLTAASQSYTFQLNRKIGNSFTIEIVTDGTIGLDIGISNVKYAVPAPATVALMGAGLMAIGFMRRRTSK